MPGFLYHPFMENALLVLVLFLFVLPILFMVQVLRKRPNAGRNLALSLGALVAVFIGIGIVEGQDASPTPAQAATPMQPAEATVEPVPTALLPTSDQNSQAIQYKTLGCASPDQLAELLRLYQQDREGWGLRLAGLLDMGICRGLEKGERVHVVDNTFTMKQIRADGDSRFFWVPMEVLRPE